MIVMKDWRVSVPEWDRVLAFEGDHLTRSVEISTDAPENFTFALDMALGNGTPRAVPLEREGTRLRADLTAAMLSAPGLYTCQLRGVDGVKVRHTDRFLLEVQYSLNAVNAFPPMDPVDLKELERRLRQVKEEAENISSHPPYIGENGNWFLWAVDAYRDSGVAASVFPEGKKGQYLGYVEDNTVEAVSFPEPEPVFPKGQAGKLLGYVEDDVVAPIDPPVTGYSKEETLSDETKAHYGWTPAVTPDMMLRELGTAVLGRRVYPEIPAEHIPKLTAGLLPFSVYGQDMLVGIGPNGAPVIGTTRMSWSEGLMMDINGESMTPLFDFVRGAEGYVMAGNGVVGVAAAAQSEKVLVTGDGMMWGAAQLPAARQWSCAACGGEQTLVLLAADSNAGAYSADIATWSEIALPGETAGWTGVAYGNGVFLAVGDGKLARSTDGTSWSAGTIPAGVWESVLYGGGTFMAVSATLLALSADGTAWETLAVPACITGNGALRTLWAGERFLLKKDGIGKVAHSTDGKTWKIRGLPASTGELGPMGYLDGSYIIVSDGTDVLKSTDGDTWTACAIEPNQKMWNRTVSGGGRFITLSNMGNHILYSEDGKRWHYAGLNCYAPVGYSSATYGNGRFVAMEGTGCAAYSTDGGRTWREAEIRRGAMFELVTFGGGRFVAFGSTGLDEKILTLAAVSADGESWTIGPVTAAKWKGLAYGAGCFVAVAEGTDKGARSEDGTVWTEITLPGVAEYSDVVFGEGRFLAIAGRGGTFAVSEDGVTWRAVMPPEGNYWAYAACGGGSFLISTNAGTELQLSRDGGTTWTKCSLRDNVSAPAFELGIWACVSRNSSTEGKSWFSPDGSDWFDNELALSLMADHKTALYAPVGGMQGPPGPTGPAGPEGPRGKDGADGKTPVKGVDYFTAEDLAGLPYASRDEVGNIAGVLDALSGEVV